MKLIYKPDFILLGKMTIIFILLINSIKYFAFLFDPLSFSYASFVFYTPKFEGILYENLIANYHNIVYTLNVIYFSIFPFFLIVIFFSYKRSKVPTINYILIMVVLALIFKVYVNFEKPGFYFIIPFSFFDNLKSYLLINGLIFIIFALLLYFFTFRKYFFKGMHKK